MFRSLLKYKLKAPSRIIIQLSIILLVISTITGLIIMSQADAKIAPTSVDVVLNLLLSFFMITVLFMVAYMIAVPLIQYYSFYKLHFGKEGYLTFSLPVSTHQHILSAALSLIIWQLIMVAVALISFTMLFLPTIIKFPDPISFSANINFGFPISGSLILNFVADLAFGAILPIVAITLGALVAKKHKLWAAFGIGFGISYGVSIISQLMIGEYLNIKAVTHTLLLNALLYAALAIGGYFLTYHIIDKKTNI